MAWSRALAGIFHDTHRRRRAGGFWLAAVVAAAGAVHAQELDALLEPDEASASSETEGVEPGAPSDAGTPPAPAPPPRADRQIEEIVVTATKSGLRSVQDVPIAVTAFGESQLEALGFRDLQSLSYTMPNVHLEDVGTVAGYANFSIRGQGINSSIPSIDPTVGVFIDGVYIGTSSGIVLDNFDLEGIEVLRGPQGVLFGRNVTGGAILLRTKLPGPEIEGTIRAAIETGLTKIVDGSVSGPVVDDLLGVKVAAYHSDDDGWFKNLFDGSEHGAAKQTLVRPAVRVTPFRSLEGILRYEHGEAEGDGPAAQNHALYERGTFDFAVNRKGFYDSDWDQLTFEPIWDVPFGNGTITSITGWRRYALSTEADIDATPDDGFYAQAALDQDQLSEELRYAGAFGPVGVTTGAYYFTQDLLYVERRLLANEVVDRTGGGDGDFSTWGVFGAADWSILENLILNLGLRYTSETKKVAVSTIATSRLDSGGSIPDRSINPNFFDEESWSDVTPKIGLQWFPLDATQLYAFWAKGFRSGGYNFRNTTDNVTPGPFDSEEQNSYEVGLKHDFSWFPARINAALFQNDIENLQRELNVPGSFGVSQTIVNAGEARIRGAEVEMRIFLFLENLSASLYGGYLDGEYKKVTADLNRDGEVTEADRRLEIPRLSPKTYGASLDHDMDLWSWGILSSRVGYSHRDKNFFTDSNAGFLDVFDGLDMNLAYITPRGRWAVRFYGSNLLNKASLGGDTPLPDDDPPLFFLFGGDGPGPLPGPTFSPLNKGRVFGVQIRYRY